MMSNHTSQTRTSVLVTGASTGIGEACALHLASRGWRVFAGVRRQDDRDTLLAKGGTNINPLLIDVTDERMIADAALQVTHSLGNAGLDGLINNAGIAISGPMEFLSPADLRRQFEVNTIGVTAVTQAFLPLLRKARGRIVNISSASAYMAIPLLGPYAASKAAMEKLSDALRIELLPWGIEVVLIQPGVVATPIWDKSLAWNDSLRGRLPTEAEQLYGPDIDAMRRYSGACSPKGMPSEKVADAVWRALTARRPKTRYRLGPDPWLGFLASRHVPTRWMDRIVRRIIGMRRPR